jgi:hypothetical protein
MLAGIDLETPAKPANFSKEGLRVSTSLYGSSARKDADDCIQATKCIILHFNKLYKNVF